MNKIKTRRLPGAKILGFMLSTKHFFSLSHLRFSKLFTFLPL